MNIQFPKINYIILPITITIIQVTVFGYQIPKVPRLLDVDCIQVQKLPPIYKTAYPQNSLYNCEEYCSLLYGHQPQRSYYNATSHMCEPLAMCKSGAHHNYADNSCYQQVEQIPEQQQWKWNNESIVSIQDFYQRVSKKNNSYIFYPQATTFRSNIDDAMKRARICVNGYSLPIEQNAFNFKCICDDLWDNSLTYDINGDIFYCDKVTDQPERHLSSKWSISKDPQYDSDLMFGSLSQADIHIILMNMKIKQERQTVKIIEESYESIMYALDEQLPAESILFSSQYSSQLGNGQVEQHMQRGSIVIIMIFLGSNFVIGITYYEYNRYVCIKVREEQFVERIREQIRVILWERGRKQELMIVKDNRMQN